MCYSNQFSTKEDHPFYCRYTDTLLPDMYHHNKIYIKQDTPRHKIEEIIKLELDRRQQQHHTFLQVEYEGRLKSVPDVGLTPEIDILDYYYVSTSSSINLRTNPNTKLQRATDHNVMEDGCKIDILANQEAMGEDFANRRIHRKKLVYQDLNSPVTLYVVYDQNKVIGNIEYMEYGTVVKLEDFDIYTPYQRQGHGSSVIKQMMDLAIKRHMNGIYVITSDEDTAKSMYEKCGFQFVGQKTMLRYQLNA